MFRYVITVKCFIAASKAARARNEKPVATAPAPEAEPEPQAESAYAGDVPNHDAISEPIERTRVGCERHNTWLNLRQKNGQQWFSQRTAEGWCRKGAK
jgi:hypothetical protein